ncbi:MAG: hypothetical protein ACJAUG_000619 [Halioglobus sp.]|jgi:hypothetical protein
MNVNEIRCENDSKLSEKLLLHPDVKRVTDKISRAEERGPLGIRRNLRPIWYWTSLPGRVLQRSLRTGQALCVPEISRR